MSAQPLAPFRPAFRALAESFVPETAQCTTVEWERLEQIVGKALADRPAGLRRQVLLFIRVLDLLARVRLGAPLASADPVRRRAWLESLARSPVLLLRRGVWGLRTLVMMGYYAQPAVQRAIGYAADPRGWEARR
jgi:hypothetical protein